MSLVLELYKMKRNRVLSMLAEIEEAEQALQYSTTPAYAKHFYQSQLPQWRERYEQALKELQKFEATLPVNAA